MTHSTSCVARRGGLTKLLTIFGGAPTPKNESSREAAQAVVDGLNALTACDCAALTALRRVVEVAQEHDHGLTVHELKCRLCDALAALPTEGE